MTVVTDCCFRSLHWRVSAILNNTVMAMLLSKWIRGRDKELLYMGYLQGSPSVWGTLKLCRLDRWFTFDKCQAGASKGSAIASRELPRSCWENDRKSPTMQYYTFLILTALAPCLPASGLTWKISRFTSMHWQHAFIISQGTTPTPQQICQGGIYVICLSIARHQCEALTVPSFFHHPPGNTIWLRWAPDVWCMWRYNPRR